MLDVLATAHSWRGGDGPFSIAPLAGLLLTLLLIRTVLHLRIGAAAVATSAVLGALFATLGGRWGYTVTLTCWSLAVLLVASFRRAAPFRRNPSF